MNSNIIHIVENFFDNTDITKLTKKNSINVNDNIINITHASNKLVVILTKILFIMQ